MIMRGGRSSIVMAALFCVAILYACSSVSPLPPPPAALAGTVVSAEEGPMEGVLVSAKVPGSTVTITVVSDHQGRYSFPASRAAPTTTVSRITMAGELDPI